MSPRAAGLPRSAVEALHQRGYLLLVLYEAYPKPVPASVARGRVAAFLGPLDAPRWALHTAYLAETGLLVVGEERIGETVYAHLRLTARGVNIAEGTVADPGVEVPEAS